MEPAEDNKTSKTYETDKANNLLCQHPPADRKSARDSDYENVRGIGQAGD